MNPHRLILKTNCPPGDVLMLTAAVRDLHRSNPGAFATDVRTGTPELWYGNPWITPLHEIESGVEVLEAHYPSIGEAGHAPRHIVEGFGRYLSEHLGVPVRTTALRGEVFMTEQEKARIPIVRGVLGWKSPYWLINAGGKSDFTVKVWPSERWQAVVDALKDEVLFVQIGSSTNMHPELKGVVDLRGWTSIRDLVHLTYHAEGVLSSISFPMHLASAVERPPGRSGTRPCVVVAGGREPIHWFAYPGHQVLHRVGALPCCAETGCWKARTLPMGDGSRFDWPEALCSNVVGDAPRCMTMIEPDEVVRAVRSYIQGGVAKPI